MKRSILFGVLAMFAVSALSVQNLNAQNVKTADKPAVNPTQAINEPKEKPKNPSAIKGSNTTVTVNPTAKDEPAKTAVRTAQNPKGQKDIKTNKPQKPGKPKIVKDKKMKDDAKADQKQEGQKMQGKDGFQKKNYKPSKPKMVKDKKMKNDGKANEQKVDQNGQGNEQKPAIVKPGKIENNAQVNEQNANQNAQGKEKPGIVKPGKIENNAQASEVKENQKQEGNYNANKKNNNPTLKKDEPQDPINNVVRPKEKVSEGTGTQNNNGTM
jgi:hypothetical protein